MSLSSTIIESSPPASGLNWHGGTLRADAGRLTLTDGVIDELDAAVDYLRANPLPVLALDLQDFRLEQTRSLATNLRHLLADGPGFALLDRFPLECWNHDEAAAAYWLLSACIGRPVAQSWDGKMVYAVRDKGKPPGNGVRPDVTKAGQNFHTDNSYNHQPPSVVGLLCLQPARSGGRSGVISFHWAHAQMRERHPELLERLYQPYYFDRQREHAPNDEMVVRHALFETIRGHLQARLSHRQVVNGHKLAGVPLDTAGAHALEAFEAILNEPGAGREFDFEPGQLQYVNNLALGHRRSAFEDFAEPERKRYLVRLWLRDHGKRGYGG